MGASLAWPQNGEQLISLRQVGGAKRLFLSEIGGDGTLADGVQVDTTGIALDRLLGSSGEQTVASVAYLLESGSIERILDIRLDGRSPADLTILPPPGVNWVDTGTLAAATDNPVAGSTDFQDRSGRGAIRPGWSPAPCSCCFWSLSTSPDVRAPPAADPRHPGFSQSCSSLPAPCRNPDSAKGPRGTGFVRT